MRLPRLFLVVTAVSLFVPAASASACPGDAPPGSARQAEAEQHICAVWNHAGYARLGHPLNTTHRWAGGYIRDFDGGSYGRGGILDGDGPRFAYIVAGPYWADYVRVGGAPGPLGYPRGDHVYAGHLHQGPAANTYMTFEGGVINRWSAGTFATWGAILTRWNHSGNVTGSLGRPLSDEHSTYRSPQGTIGRYSRFEHGVIDYNPKVNRAVVLFGAILSRYAQMGYASSRLGLPTEEEFDWGGGRRQNFEGGYLYWKAGFSHAIGRCYDHHGGYEAC